MCDHCGCREYGPIAELTADHEEILRLAWLLAEAGGAVATVRDELLRRLDLHVDKEETWLYPELLQAGDLSVEAAASLEDEHRVVRTTLLSGSFDRRDFYALAAHIEEEEFALFPAAMFAFDDDVWERLVPSR